MAEAKGNTAVPRHGDVDRVQMLSLRSDGAPDQTPGFEIIGDKETALAQAREQFAQQAVSAADQGDQVAAADDVDQTVQDPTIAARQERHEAAAAAAVEAADATIEAAFVDPAPAPAPVAAPKPGPAKSGKD